MAKQVINIGSVANDGTGDPLRNAFDKVNDNFTELYDDDAADVNSVSAGTGISVDQTTGDVTVTNSAPDQTVALTDGGDIAISGTYPSFTLTNSAPNATHTGDVTGATALTIASGAVTNAKMAANSVDSDQYVDASIDTEHFSLTAAINTVTDQNTGALKLWSGSQATYDGLTPDASTIYFIV